MNKEFGIKVIKNRLIVKPNPLDDKTASGLIIVPDAEQIKTGLVVQCTDLCSIKVGDTVYFNHDIGSPITHNGEKYLVMRDDNLLAVNSR